jgi:hypothetical protein
MTGNNCNCIAGNSINKAMLKIYPPAPTAFLITLQWLRLAFTLKGSL